MIPNFPIMASTVLTTDSSRGQKEVPLSHGCSFVAPLHANERQFTFGNFGYEQILLCNKKIYLKEPVQFWNKCSEACISLADDKTEGGNAQRTSRN